MVEDRPSPAVDDALQFNDATTATATATATANTDLHVYLHRSKYFSTLHSDRWSGHVHASENSSSASPPPSVIQPHLTVLELLYTNDFTVMVNSASTALDLLPVPLELLFE